MIGMDDRRDVDAAGLRSGHRRVVRAKAWQQVELLTQGIQDGAHLHLGDLGEGAQVGDPRQ